MALRMERSADNCAALAAYLASHPLVKKVNYPGLAKHPGHELHLRQATSGGSLLSFETGNVEASKVGRWGQELVIACNSTVVKHYVGGRWRQA